MTLLLLLLLGLVPEIQAAVLHRSEADTAIQLESKLVQSEEVKSEEHTVPSTGAAGWDADVQQEAELEAQQKEAAAADAAKEAEAEAIAQEAKVISDVLIALPTVCANLSNVSSAMSYPRDNEGMHGHKNITPPHHTHPMLSHQWGENIEEDEAIIKEQVSGYMTVLHTYFAQVMNEDGDQYCPKGKVSVIRRCVEIGMCFLESRICAKSADVNKKDEATGKQSLLKQFVLYREQLDRTFSTTWNDAVHEMELKASESNTTAKVHVIEKGIPKKIKM